LQLAVTLSRDGGSQLYMMGANGGEPRRLTQSQHRHRAGVLPPTAALYFVSDRGGTPQIYRMPAGGGAAERVTFTGGLQHQSPAVSPDGRWTWPTCRSNGVRLQAAADGPGRPATSPPLTDTTEDEKPEFRAQWPAAWSTPPARAGAMR
jgi:TolB protein